MRDVVLITIDTLRWDAVGWSGEGRAATPSLDRLAAEGRAFLDARAHAVVTLPSHATILSGRLPYEHGVRDNALFSFHPDVPTLATILSERGYACGAFVSAFPLDRRFGLARGFEIYDDEVSGRGSGRLLLAERPGRETVSRALSWWESRAGRPRFLWIHVFEPHFPYVPEEPFASRHREAPYFGEVETVDRILEPLLARVRESGGVPAPIVVVTADHGEALGEHGERTHGLLAHDATLKVPLLVWGPGAVEPGRDPEPARHVDVLPTILALVGVDLPSGVQGRSLLEAGPRSGAPLYFEALTGTLTRGAAPLHGWMEDGFKAVDLPIPELYDLRSDPGEARNLAEERPDRLREMVARIPAEAREIEVPRSLDREARARLESLGYVASAAGRPAAFGPEEDPKRIVLLEQAVEDALALHREGRSPEAIENLEAAIEAHPRVGVLYERLALIHAERGQPAAGLAVLARASALGVASPEMEANLALGLAQSGRVDEGRALLARHADSPDPQIQMTLGVVAALHGDPAEARSRLERALALDPTFPQARIQLAVLELQRNRPEAARAELERALVEDPTLADGWNAEGAARAGMGDLAGAVEAWERAVSIEPRLASAWLNLARAWTARGDRERAAQALASALPHLPPGERDRIVSAAREARAPGAIPSP
jgi:arylsulfatase A-like enzyme/Tfp pilus assembly protein PilF